MKINKDVDNILKNVSRLSKKERLIYRGEFLNRVQKQLHIVTLVALCTYLLFCAALIILPQSVIGWSIVLFFALCTLGITMLLTRPQLVLPFKIGGHADFFRWWTRQAPNWFYRSAKRLGPVYVLYGDAMIKDQLEIKENPEKSTS